MDAWAEYRDYPEWFASGFSGTVQAGNEKEADGASGRYGTIYKMTPARGRLPRFTTSLVQTVRTLLLLSQWATMENYTGPQASGE